MSEASGQGEVHLQPPKRHFTYDAREPESQKVEARQYKRRIVIVRRLLPAAAVVLIVAVLFAPQLQPFRDIFTGQSALLDAESGGVALVTARFRGTDSSDRPYSLTAEQVHERAGEEDRYDLVNPQGDITMSDGAWLTLGATDGLYDRSGEHLSLEGSVSLFHDQGYEMHTETAEIDLVANEAWGDSPVSGQAGFGEIVAEGFRLEEGGLRIHFTGKAELLLYPDAEGFPQ